MIKHFSNSPLAGYELRAEFLESYKFDKSVKSVGFDSRIDQGPFLTTDTLQPSKTCNILERRWALSGN